MSKRPQAVYALLALSLATSPVSAWAAPASEPDSVQPTTEDASTPLEPPAPVLEPPAPTLEPPSPEPEPEPEPEPVEDFAVPPPGPPPSADELEGELARPSFPDPGVAPDDGMSMLVLSGTTLGLTAAGFGAAIALGLRDEVPLGYLLPSTLVPTVGLLAFAGGGLYLGVDRRRKYRAWEAGYRVVGLPQGKGLRIGASFALLGALAMIPSGAYALSEGQVELGAPLLSLGLAAAIATPTMFIVSAQRRRRYARTGGWIRPELPPRPSEAGLRLSPRLSWLRGGATIGVAGRF